MDPYPARMLMNRSDRRLGGEVGDDESNKATYLILLLFFDKVASEARVLSLRPVIHYVHLYYDTSKRKQLHRGRLSMGYYKGYHSALCPKFQLHICLTVKWFNLSEKSWNLHVVHRFVQIKQGTKLARALVDCIECQKAKHPVFFKQKFLWIVEKSTYWCFVGISTILKDALTM